jgi:hypothetical protein
MHAPQKRKRPGAKAPGQGVQWYVWKRQTSPLRLQDMTGPPLAGKGSGRPVGVDPGEGFCLPAGPCLKLTIAGGDQVSEENRIRAIPARKSILLAFKNRLERNRHMRRKGRSAFALCLTDRGTLAPHIGTAGRCNRVHSHVLTPHCVRMARLPRLSL